MKEKISWEKEGKGRPAGRMGCGHRVVSGGYLGPGWSCGDEKQGGSVDGHKKILELSIEGERLFPRRTRLGAGGDTRKDQQKESPEM